MIARAFSSLSDLFSNVRFGIWLLAILFVYMTVGSAGIVYPTHPNLLHPDAWTHAQLRQWRPFEMTEFEWFHWWPFDLLLALIAANMAWTTLRRIPLRVVNLGVWMIHAGILTLIAGSVWYFGTKVEGDAPVARRAIDLAVTATDGTRGVGRLVAMPGAATEIRAGRESWQVQVAQIDPSWELRTGDAAGERSYSVTLLVQGPGGRFMRQVIAGRPDLAEDLILTDDPSQPLQRAKKAKGSAIVNPGFEAVADYESQGFFYLKNDLNKSWALYVRRPGDARWVERPMRGLPLYNDYVPAEGLAFAGERERVPIDPLDVAIPPVAADDPFPGVTLKATGYLRYAFERTRMAKGPVEAPINPAARVSIEAEGGPAREMQLLAFDDARQRDESELVTFRWADTAEALQAFAQPSRITFDVGGGRSELASDAWSKASEAFVPVGAPQAGVQVKVVAVQEGLKLSGGRVSVAILDVRSPKGEFRRWVFDRPALNRDMKPGENPDPKAPANNLLPELEARFVPGLAQTPVTLVAGPDPAALTLIDVAEGAVRSRPAPIGQSLPLAQGLSLRVTEYFARAVVERRPFIVPPAQRMKDAREQFAMALVQAPDGTASWLRYHDCVFDRPEQAIRRRLFEPTTLRLSDGTVMEVMFSRCRLPLPSPVALERFEIAAHQGGFTGETSTIRDYVSLLRFADGQGGWGEPQRVSVNQPVEHGGLWYFQAQWDPPDEGAADLPPSLGLNYTVLGVGSRHGVGMQLAGCILAAIGMAYAFYVKPVIKRRALARQKAMVRPSGVTVTAAMLLVALAQGVDGVARAEEMVATTATIAALGDSKAQDERGANTEPASMQQVDLSVLEDAAVMSEGRVKSLGSFAFGWMQQISGPKRIRSGEPPTAQSPLFTLLDLALRPQAYADADVVYVKNREVRVRLEQALRAADPSLAERLRGFESHGLIAPDLLWDAAAGGWRADIASVMRQMEGDLIRTSKQVDQMRGSIAMMQPQQIRARLRMLPVPQADRPWQTLDEATGAVAEAWLALQRSWVQGDAPAVQKAGVQLAAALRAQGGAALPSEGRLHWESWYFRSSQMTWVWFVYFAALALLLLGFSWKWPRALSLGLVVFAAAFLLQTFAVGLRWYVSDRWPNSNMFEAVTTASWMGAALAALVEAIFRRLPVRGLFALGASAGCMLALMACALLPAQLNPAIGNMMPVLHDVWLYIHTNVIIFSYALIFMAAVTAAMYLVWRWRGGAPAHARVGGAGEMLALAGESVAANLRVPGEARHGVVEVARSREAASEGEARESPTSSTAAAPARMGEILDGVTMTLMELSFVLLWSGIAMGAIWADHSWGRPWGWDPKEVFALNTFVVFALLIHVRWRSRDKGLWTAVLAVAGAAVMLFNWIVINFVITGLHSYA